MNADQKKRIKEILRTLKTVYIDCRGRGGLNREAWGPELEVFGTEFLDDELTAAFQMLARKELATELGIESWVRQDEIE